MAETVFIPESSDRKVVYEAIIPQLRALFVGEKNLIANTANAMAVLHQAFQFHWVGCYFVEENQLVLGPFQGPVACTRINFGKGVCGTAWQQQKTIIVPDVEAFPGHIACSALSKSEIVVPIFNAVHHVIGVLDVDSSNINDFSEVDQFYLEKIAGLLTSNA